MAMIMCRTHGLFPPGDPLLVQLASEAGTHAFEKHLAGENKPYELLKNGSWTSGDEAAQAGFDLRLFYKALLPIYHLTLAVTTWSLCWVEASARAQLDLRHGET